MRLTHLPSKDQGRERSAIQHPGVDNQGTIAVFHVHSLTLKVASIDQLGKLVLQRNRTILGFASSWCPTAMGVAVFHGENERTTIRSGLPAGENVLAEANRLGEVSAKGRKRHPGAIDKNFAALVDAVVWGGSEPPSPKKGIMSPPKHNKHNKEEGDGRFPIS